ncbi:MAG: hypothetical protein AAF823_07375 [Planctomycetota bacterium]
MPESPDTPRYWFPKKKPGWGYGWGPPSTWEGWVVLLGYFVLSLGGAAVYLWVPVLSATAGFLAWTTGLSIVLLIILSRTGEPLHDRGGR